MSEATPETPMTRGQKAAATRAANKAAAEAAVDVSMVSAVPVAQAMEFLNSIKDIERYVYGDVQDGTIIITEIAGHQIAAAYDGEQWHMVL